jgi:PBP1b-binding outer membrane lipoprotein LpoB
MLKFFSNCLLITLFFILISGCSSANNNPKKEEKPVMATVTINVSDKDNKPLKNIKVTEIQRPDGENNIKEIGHILGHTDKNGNIKWGTVTGKHDIILYAPKSEDESQKHTINITEDTTTINLVYK